LVPHSDDPTDQMFVFFPDEFKISVNTIRVYCQRMEKENISRAIIVGQTRVSMTSSARKVRQSILC